MSRPHHAKKETRPPMAASPPRTVTLTLRGQLQRPDLCGLLASAHALLDGGGVEVLCCEVSRLGTDAVAVDALARLALMARGRGCRVQVRGACAELQALIELIGLAEVLLG